MWVDFLRASWTLRPSLIPYSGAAGPLHPGLQLRPVDLAAAEQGITSRSSAHPLTGSPLSQSSKYHLDGNLRISRALSIGLICARYRILALCQSRSSWRPTETRDNAFMGPGKQRVSERSLWWTVKRKDTTNNSLD